MPVRAVPVRAGATSFEAALMRAVPVNLDGGAVRVNLAGGAVRVNLGGGAVRVTLGGAY